MADFTQESAREARDMYDGYQLFLSTPFGQKLVKKMRSIDQTASDKALRGSTPENTNVFFEARGTVSTIFQLNQMFRDIEKENEDAVTWLQANSIATASEEAE
jgi:hypothetical protein